MKKRILALVLTLAMLLSLFPGQVFAARTAVAHTEHNYEEVPPETQPPTEDGQKAPVKSTQAVDSIQDLLNIIDYDAAVKDLEYLTRTIGTRPAGSIGEHMAAEYVRNVFDELGYDSSVQEVPISKNSYWPGTIGEIYLGDLTLSGFGPLSSANYTGFGHAEGTAVYLSDPANVASLGSDLSGKVVFFPGNWRSGKDPDTLSCIQALDAANAEGIVVLMDHTIDPAEASNTWFPTLSISASNPISTPILLCNNYEYERVPAYLAEHPDTAVSLDSRNSGIHSHNAIGIKKAAVETDWTIYVTGHMDSVMPGPGANDNASGTLGVLALARAFKDIETNYNIAFITLGAEEIGLVGSKYFAQNLTTDQINHAIGCYNMDMIATSVEGCDIIYMMVPTNDFSLTSNKVENRVVLSTYRAAEQLGYDMDKVTAVKEWASDHSSFNDVGIPAVGFILSKSATSLVTETVYHTINDSYFGVDSTTDNFDFDRLENSVDLVATAVYNDATANYEAVMGTGINREYYTTVAEAMSASTATGAQVALMSTGEILNYSHSHKTSDGTTTTVSKALLADMVPGGQTVTLESGQYFLPEDVTTNVTFEIKGDVEICLNGRTLTFDISSGDAGAQNGGFYVNGGTLIIDDTCSTGAGRITASSSSTGENLAPIRVSGNGSLTLDTVRVDTTTRVRSTKNADTGSNGQEESAIIVEAGSTATIDQSNLSGSEYGIWNQGTVTVNGGNIDGSVYGIKNEGTLSVENCYIGYGRTAVQYGAGEVVFIPFLEGTTAATTSAWNGGIHGCTFNIDHTRGILYGNITLDDPYVPMGSNTLNYVIKSGDILEMRQMTSGLKEEELKIAEESWKTDDEFIHNVESFWVTSSNTGYNAGYGREGDMIHNTGTYQTVVYTVNKPSGQLVGATLRRLRVDPVATHKPLSAGYFEYDYIYFGPENRSPAAIMASVDKADYGVYNTRGSTFNLGSHVEIYGSDTDIYLGKGVVVATSDAVTTPEDGNISVKTEADPAVAAVKLTSGWPAGKDQSVITYIPSHNEGEDCSVTLKDAELYIVSPNSAEHNHCVYGEVCPDKKAGKTCTHTKVLFDTPIDSTNFDLVLSTPGRYYLTEDIELTGEFGFRNIDDIYLCLNGFKITSTKQLNIANDTKVYLCNCRRTDVAGSGTCYIDRAVLKYGELHLHSGTLSMSADGASNVDSSGKLVIDGGTFTANTGYAETNVYAAYESTVNPTDAYIILKSGRVENLGSQSSAVCHIGYGYLTMNGDIELAGSEAFGDIWLYPVVSNTPALITLEEGFDPNGKVYTVRWGLDPMPGGEMHQITSGWGAVCDSIGYIPFDAVAGYAIIQGYDANGNKELFIVRDEEKENFKVHEHCVYGENCEYTKEGKPCEHDKVGFVTALNGSNFATSINKAGHYYLTDNVTLTSALQLNCGGEIYLCLNGHSILGDSILGEQFFGVMGSTTLYLCNCTRKSATDAYIYSNRPGVGFNQSDNRSGKGTLYFYGGTISFNSELGFHIGAGSVVEIDGGSIIADPGTIAEDEGVIYSSDVGGTETIILKSGYLENKGQSSALSTYGFGKVILDGDIDLVNSEASGNITLFDYYRNGSAKFTLGENFAPADGKIYTVQLSYVSVASGSKYRISEGWDAHYHKFDKVPFESSQNYSVIEYYENGVVELYLVNKGEEDLFKQHYHVLKDGRRIYYLTELNQDVWTQMGGNFTTSGSYVLTGDVSLGGSGYFPKGIPAGLQIDLCLHGHSFGAQGIEWQPGTGVTFRVDDCTPNDKDLGSFNWGQIWPSGSHSFIFANGRFTSHGSRNWSYATTGSFTIEGGYFTSQATQVAIGPTASNTDTYRIAGGSLVCTTAPYVIDADVKAVYMSGSPVITGRDADIGFYDYCKITFEEGKPLTPPAGETYRLSVNRAVTADSPMRITEGWENSGLSSMSVTGGNIPFVSTQGYAVRELYCSETNSLELYFTTDSVHSHDVSTETGNEAPVTFYTPLEEEYLAHMTRSSGIMRLGGGKYFLTHDVSVPSDVTAIEIWGEAYLCLNGYSLDLGELARLVVYGDGGSLRLCDCHGGGGEGKITSSYDGATLHVEQDGLCYIYGGTVENTRTQGVTVTNHGALYNKGQTYIYGGTLIGNKTGIFAEAGTVEISGGTVQVNTDQSTYALRIKGTAKAKMTGGTLSAQGKNGTGIYASDNTEIEITGGTIQATHYGISHNCKSVTVSGKPDIETTTADFYLYEGKTVTIGESFAAPTEAYTVVTAETPTEGNPVQVTTGWSTYEAATDPFHFVAKNPAYAVRKSSDGELYLGILHVHTMSVDCSVSENDADNIIFATELNQDNIESYIGDDNRELQPGYYVLTEGVSTSYIYTPADTYICLNGYTLTFTHEKVGFQPNSGTLYLCDCSEGKTGTVYKESTNAYSCPLTTHTGTAKIYGGNYPSNGANGLTNYYGSLYFYDGVVFGKSTGISQGYSGLTEVTGGIITSDGMGIEYYAGEFRLSGNPIINGKSEDIYLYNGRIITISGLLTPPDGETYSVRLDKDATKPTVGHPIQITEGFHENGNSYNCFTSADPNYFTYVRNGEVYLGVKANITVQTEGEGTAVAKDANGNVISMALETDTVKIDATPASGHFAGRLVLTYMEGETQVTKELVPNAQGDFEFTMPATNVTAKVYFYKTHIHTLADGTEIVYDKVLTQAVYNTTSAGSGLVGAYLLLEDINTNGRMNTTYGERTDICLCGHTITAGNLYFSSYSTVRIDDCTDSGEKTPDGKPIAKGTLKCTDGVTMYNITGATFIFANGTLISNDNSCCIWMDGKLYITGGKVITSGSPGIDCYTAGTSEWHIQNGIITATGEYAVGMDSKKLVLSGSPILTGGQYDIKLYYGYQISFEDGKPLNPPAGETYSIKLFNKTPTAEEPVPITKDWQYSGLASTATQAARPPFVSVQGYAVREINGELYLVIPEVTLNVNDDTKGSASVDPMTGKENTEITVTATPNENKLLRPVTMTYWNGAETVTETVEMTKDENGTYTGTFKMPAADVTVNVVFEDPHTHPLTEGMEDTLFMIELDRNNLESYLVRDGSKVYLTGGNYVLLDDITVSNSIIIDETVNLCLNGHSMNFGTNELTINGTLNVCDCSEGETGSFNPYETMNNEGASFCIYSGKVTTDTTTEGYMLVAGGSLIERSGSKLIVHNKGTLEITGGYLKPNGPYGIYSYSSSASDRVLRITGGTIDGGTSATVYVGNTEFHFGGEPVLTKTRDIYLAAQGQTIIIDSPVTGGSYGIYGTTSYFEQTLPIRITDNWDAHKTDPIPFTSGKTEYLIFEKAGELYFVVEQAINIQVEGNGTAVVKNTFGNVITKAVETSTVFVDGTPAEGYTVAKVVLSYMNGASEVRKVIFADADGNYKFTMPNAEATVTVTFREPHIHTLADGSTIVYDTFVDQEVWDSIRGSVPEGNYVLVDHVSGRCSLKSNSYINICLCGFDLYANAPGSETYLNTGTTLRIDDCTPDDELLGTISMPQVYAKGPGHIIIADGIYHGYGSIASIALNGGSFTMEGGYFISDASMGMALGSQVAGISDFYILGGSLKCTTGMVLEGDCGKIVLGGDPAITGKDYDIRFYPGHLISFDKDYPLNPPTGETYILHLASGSVTAEQPVQLTSGWADSGLASTATTEAKIPFVSAQGYAVREMDTGNGTKELYLVIPMLTAQNDGNGSLTVNNETTAVGAKGTVFYLDAKPNDGYELNTVTMTYWDGTKTVSTVLSPNGDGQYEVTMPAADVTVTATFKELHNHCIYGINCPDKLAGNECTHDSVIFAKELTQDNFPADGKLAGGEYVLTGPVTFNGTVTITENVKLCLNGNTLDLGDKQIVVSDGAVLNICDCNGSGNGAGKICSNIAGNTISNEGTLNLYGGIIENSADSGTSCALSTAGETNIYGGTVTGVNKGMETTGTTTVYGGTVTTTGTLATDCAIDAMGGQLVIHGGEITTGTEAVAIFVREGAKLTIDNGTVHSETGHGIFTEGTVSISGGNFTTNSSRHGEANRKDCVHNNGGVVAITGGEFATLVTGNNSLDAFAHCVRTVAGTTTIEDGHFYGYTTIRANGGVTYIKGGHMEVPAGVGHSVNFDGGIVHISGGTLTGNYPVHSLDGNGTCYITGGNIGDKNANSAIRVDSGKVYVQGGTITAKNIGIEIGGYADNYGTVYVSGGEINARTGISVATDPAILYMSDSPVIHSTNADVVLNSKARLIHFEDGKPLVHPEGGTYSVRTINLTSGNYVRFTENWEQLGLTEYPFHSAQGYYVMELEYTGRKELYMVLEEDKDLFVPHVHDGIDFSLPMGSADFTTITEGTYFITKGFNAGSPVPFNGGEIHLCLNGNTFKNLAQFELLIQNGAKVYIYDCKGTAHMELHDIRVDKSGTGNSELHLKGGTFTCTTFNPGIPEAYRPEVESGVSLHSAGSKLYLEGATLNLCDPNDPQFVATADGARLILKSGTINDTVGTGCILADPSALDVEMNGPVVLSSANNGPEIILNNGAVIYVTGDITPKEGETYTVLTNLTPTAESAIRITEGYETSGTKINPFVSTQGYAVVEQFCTQTQQTELYLAMPTITTVVIPEGFGTLEADYTTCMKGTTVTLTAEPIAHYSLDSLVATYVENGVTKTLELTENNGVYTFTMPGANVIVTARFKENHKHILDDGTVVYFDNELTQAMWDRYTVSNGTTLPSGNYVLTEDIKRDQLWIRGGAPSVNFCLCGHDFVSKSAFKIYNTEAVSFVDCTENKADVGEISGTYYDDGNFANVYMENIKLTLSGSANNGVGIIVMGKFFAKDCDITTAGKSYGLANCKNADNQAVTIIGGSFTSKNVHSFEIDSFESFVMGGSPVVSSGRDYDILLYASQDITKISFMEEYPLLPPEGQIYRVKVDKTLSTTEPSIRITTDWEKSGLASHKDENGNFVSAVIPFVSTQGYKVVELYCEETRQLELYLVVPELKDTLGLYLWAGHEIKVTEEALLNAIMNCDSLGYFFTEGKSYSLVDITFEGLAGITVDADNYSFGAATAGTYEGKIKVSFKDAGGNAEEVSGKVKAHVYDVQDSIYVMDFAHPLDMSTSLYLNDALQGANVSVEGFAKTAPAYVAEGPVLSFAEGTLAEGGKGTYGTFTAHGKDVTYTTTDMLSDTETMYAILRACGAGETAGTVMGTADPFKEAELVKTIKVIPANVVYYEDTNEALVWGTEGSKISITPVGESSVGYQDGEINDEYGNDPGYAYDPGVGDDGNVGTYVGSGGTHKEIVINGAGTILQFTFTGTGFDVIGRTNASSGTIRYRVYQDNKQLYNGLVDTSYQGDIYQVPLLHKEMEYGTYTVKLEAIVEYDWNYTGPWPEPYLPPVKTAYLWLDGVRIYNPLAMGDEDRQYYNNDGEETARFVEIRELIRDGKGASVSFTEEGVFKVGAGSIFYLETAQKGASYTGNSTTNGQDYLVAGPNNELYFNSAKQAAVLYVKAEDATKATMLQVGIRKLNSGAFGTAGTPGVMSLGTNNSKEILVDNTKASIGYAEQYYTVDLSKCETEVIGGETYFRVVISAMGGAPFVMTNLKYSNLVFAKIPEVQDTVDFGETTEVNYSLPNLPRLARQLRMAYDMLPEDEMVAEDQELAFVGVSLNLHSSIAMNIYVDEAILEGYEDPYVLVEKQHGDRVVYETAKAVPTGKKMIGSMSCLNFYYPGITSKEMSATVRLTLYAWKDGVLTRGVSIDYGILTYAKNTLSKNNNPTLRTMLVDMLNYGAEAQIYWDYHTEFLANSTLTEAEKALATVQEPVLVDGSIEDDPSIPGSGSYPYSIIGASLLLMDKVEINYFLNAGEGDFSGKKLVITYVDASGKDVKREIPAQAFTHVADTYYKVTFDGLNAKDMRVPVTCWIADEKEERLSNALTYSIESYAASYSGEGTLRELLMDMMRYGDAAHAYFTTRKNG